MAASITNKVSTIESEPFVLCTKNNSSSLMDSVNLGKISPSANFTLYPKLFLGFYSLNCNDIKTLPFIISLEVLFGELGKAKTCTDSKADEHASWTVTW